MMYNTIEKKPLSVLDSDIMIFEESKGGYRQRTIENVQASDATLMMAIDPHSAGEMLTWRACRESKKPVLRVHISTSTSTTAIDSDASPCNRLTLDKTSKEMAKFLTDNKVQHLNVAGNCLDKFVKHGISQSQLDDLVLAFLRDAIANTKDKEVGVLLHTVRSGGQSGIDEAGAKAGAQLKLKTIVRAPTRWMFRKGNGQDVSSSMVAFQSRFKENKV